MLSGITAPRLSRAARIHTHAPRYSHALPDARASESSPLCRAADAATDAAALLAASLACHDVTTARALSRTAAGALWDASLDCVRGSRMADAGSLSRAACLAAQGRCADASMLVAWTLPALLVDSQALRAALSRVPPPSPVVAARSPAVARAQPSRAPESSDASAHVSEAARALLGACVATMPPRPAKRSTQPRDSRGRFTRRA